MIFCIDIQSLVWGNGLSPVHVNHFDTDVLASLYQVKFSDNLWRNNLKSCFKYIPRNLKYLSPVSMLANLLQFGGLGIIFYYLLHDLPYSWERKQFSSWKQLPLYFGTAIYAFEVISFTIHFKKRQCWSIRMWLEINEMMVCM